MLEPKDLGGRPLTPGELDAPEVVDTVIDDIEPSADAPSEEKKETVTKGDDSQKKVEYTARERQLYEREKKAQEKLKLYREKFGHLEDQTPERKEIFSKDSTVDPFSLAKTVASLKDYDAAEIDYIATISKVKNISPEEAVKSNEVKLWLVGKRGEDYKNNKIPVPGGSGSGGKSIPSSEEIAKMTPEQHKQLERDFLAKQRNKGSGL